MADGLHPVDQFAFVVVGLEIGVAGVFDQAGDALQGPVPVLFLPFVAFRRPVEDLAQTVLVGLGQTEEAGALGAEGTFVDRMIRVAFDVDDLAGINIPNRHASTDALLLISRP